MHLALQQHLEWLTHHRKTCYSLAEIIDLVLAQNELQRFLDLLERVSAC
jgi:hypothetical protein